MNSPPGIPVPDYPRDAEYHRAVHRALLTDPVYFQRRAILAKTRYFAGIPGNARVLDFGAGLGQNTLLMPRAECYEPGPFAHAWLAAHGRIVVPPGRLGQSDYDGALLCHVLEHVPNAGFVLETLRYSIRPGGFAVGVVPLESRWKRHARPAGNHLATYHLPALMNAFATVGLRVTGHRVACTGLARLLGPLAQWPALYDAACSSLGRLREEPELIVHAVRV